MLFVEFDGRRPTSALRGDQMQRRLLLWNRAFVNAVSLEEALIDKGGERRSSGWTVRHPGAGICWVRKTAPSWRGTLLGQVCPCACMAGPYSAVSVDRLARVP